MARAKNDLTSRARRISSISFLDDKTRAAVIAKEEGEKRRKEFHSRNTEYEAKCTHLTSLATFIFQRSKSQSAFSTWKELMMEQRAQEHERYIERLTTDARKIFQASKNRSTNINRTSEEIEKLKEWATVIQKDVFLHLDPDAIRDTMKQAIYRTYSDGEWPFVQGDPGVHFCIVFSGSLALCADAPKSSIMALKKDRLSALKDATIQNGYLGKMVFRMNTGASFGEVALQAENGTRTASIAALGNCELVLIPKNVYMRNMHARGTEAFQNTQKLAMLPHFPFFNDWTRSKIMQMSAYISYTFIPFGKQFVTEGTKPTACFFIASGTVSVSKQIVAADPTADKSSVVLHSRLVRDSHGPRRCTVQAGTLSRYDSVGLEMLVYPNRTSDFTFTVSSSSCAVFQLDRKDVQHFHAANKTPEGKKRILDAFVRLQAAWMEKFDRNQLSLIPTLKNDHYPSSSQDSIQPATATTKASSSVLSSPTLLSSCARIQPKPYAPSSDKRTNGPVQKSFPLENAMSRFQLTGLCQDGKGLQWHPSKGVSSFQVPIKPAAPPPSTSIKNTKHPFVQAADRIRSTPYTLRRTRLAKNKCRKVTFPGHFDRTVDRSSIDSTFKHQF